MSAVEKAKMNHNLPQAFLADVVRGAEIAYERPEFDTHIHSMISDGVWWPSRVVAEARRRGLRAIALTDHDHISGLAEALRAGAESGIAIVPGVEIDTDEDGVDAEILGYNVLGPDGTDRRIEAFFLEINRRRLERTRRWIELINQAYETGQVEEINRSSPLQLAPKPARPLDLQALLEHRLKRPIAPEKMDDWLVRLVFMTPHMCLFLLECGYIVNPPPSDSLREVKRAFFVKDKPFHVPIDTPTQEQAIGEIRQSGGTAVLAHPALIKNLEPEWKPRESERFTNPRKKGKIYPSELIERLVDQGLGGIELYFYEASRDEQFKNQEESRQANAYFARLAESYGLLTTFGSDCHGPRQGVDDVKMGRFGGRRRITS